MQVRMSLIEIKKGSMRDMELVESGSFIIFAFFDGFSCLTNFTLLFSSQLVIMSFKAIDSIVANFQ